MDDIFLRKVISTTLIILITITTALGKPVNRSIMYSNLAISAYSPSAMELKEGEGILQQFGDSIIVQEELLAKPCIDKRVEMLSIVFRLAGNPEYNSEIFKNYLDLIKTYYEPYKDHALINFVKQIKKEQGLGYDAVMSMAVHLNKELNLQAKDNIESLDKRWSKDNAIKFSKLLKQFYKDTHSEEFFNQNKNLYSEVEKRFFPIYQSIDVSWYHRFYGKEPTEKFLIVNGLGNGGANYGVAVHIPNTKKEVYAILGTWSIDSLGIPQFSKEEYVPILLHEFNHSFVNYLLEKDPSNFKNSGEQLFSLLKDKMRSQAYGSWETMLNEAMVRAAVIKYMKDHHFSPENIQDEINKQLARGFYWINELVAELEKYDTQRDKYPTLEHYMPILAQAYIAYTSNIQELMDDYEQQKPKIVSFDEIQNGELAVNTTLKQLTINFDKPLLGKGHSFNGISRESFPKITKSVYSADKRSVTIYFDLEKNKNYEIIFTGKAFRTISGIPMNDYLFKFSTK